MRLRLKFIYLCAVLTACQSEIQSEAKLNKSNDRSSAKWIALEGGCFDMGETRIYREEGPVTNTCLKPFAIWSHEISNSEFAAFVKATGHKTRAELGWKASDDAGPGVDMAPGSAVFDPPEKPQGLNWWRLTDGALSLIHI